MTNWSFLTEDRMPEGLAFSHFDFDRAGLLRDDAAFLEGAWAAPEMRCLAILGEQVVLKKGPPVDALFEARDIAGLHPRERVFLGTENGAPRFAKLLDEAASNVLSEREDLTLVGLRQVALESMLSHSHLSALATAKALLFWHSRHRFCSVCGTRSELRQGGWRRDCPACEAQHFPRTDPVVIMLAVRGDYCLLGRNARFPGAMYSTLAGFVEPGETLEAAVRREVLEEAGIETGRVRYLASQPWPFPASVMIGCIAEALSETITIDTTELEDVRWFSRDEAIQLLEGRHPLNVGAPGKIAIARVLLNAWVTGKAGF